MKPAIPYIFLTLFRLISIISAEPKTITLQNGLNQYGDFEDTYSHNRHTSTNNANAEFLEIRCDGC